MQECSKCMVSVPFRKQNEWIAFRKLPSSLSSGPAGLSLRRKSKQNKNGMGNDIHLCICIHKLVESSRVGVCFCCWCLVVMPYHFISFLFIISVLNCNLLDEDGRTDGLTGGLIDRHTKERMFCICSEQQPLPKNATSWCRSWKPQLYFSTPTCVMTGCTKSQPFLFVCTRSNCLRYSTGLGSDEETLNRIKAKTTRHFKHH